MYNRLSRVQIKLTHHHDRSEAKIFIIFVKKAFKRDQTVRAQSIYT